MKDDDRERIEEDYEYLGYCLRFRIRRLVKFLLEKEIISNFENEEVMDEVSDTLKAETLIDYILKKEDDDIYDIFYDGVLQHCQLWKAADILKPENGPHRPTEDTVALLPEQWPTESHFGLMKMGAYQSMNIEKVGPKYAKMIANFEECAKESIKSYDMSQKVRGRALIIVNKSFDDFVEFPPRQGLDNDQRGLDYIFSQLGFEIKIRVDLTRKQMEEAIEIEKGGILQKHNCFVLVILSYGTDRYVFGKDGCIMENIPMNAFTFEEIKKTFSTEEKLVNKPKVLIIESQPSRSSRNFLHPEIPSFEYHKPLPSSFVHESDGAMFLCSDGLPSLDGLTSMLQPPLKFPPLQVTKMLNIGNAMSMTEADHDNNETSSSNTAPSSSDIFEIIAKSRVTLFHQNKGLGSWFVQGFIFVLANYAHQLDLTSLVEKVNELDGPQNKVKHVCELKTTVNKKLYFFPGLPHTDSS